jgi:hypothetical protein
MSYHSEHKRIKPVLDLARKLDIASNPDPTALYEAGNAGFQIWCTPDDHPEGWDDIQMNAGAFSKPCEYVGSVHWKWEGEQIVALEISTTAYALTDQKPGEYNRQSIANREADIEWLVEKIAWLFEKAGVVMPSYAIGAG